MPSGELSSTTSSVAPGSAIEDGRGDGREVLGLVVGRQDHPRAGAEGRGRVVARRPRIGARWSVRAECTGAAGRRSRGHPDADRGHVGRARPLSVAEIRMLPRPARTRPRPGTRRGTAVGPRVAVTVTPALPGCLNVTPASIAGARPSMNAIRSVWPGFTVVADGRDGEARRPDRPARARPCPATTSTRQPRLVAALRRERAVGEPPVPRPAAGCRRAGSARSTRCARGGRRRRTGAGSSSRCGSAASDRVEVGRRASPSCG